MPQRPRCTYCDGEHDWSKCPHRTTHLQQKEANDIARARNEELRRNNRETDRRNRRMETLVREANAVQLEKARREEDEREERQAKEGRWRLSARRIRDLKKRAADLRRDAEDDLEESWIGLRSLLAEAEEVEPDDVHPAERADFDAFTDKLRVRFKKMENALGSDVRSNMRTWLRLQRRSARIVSDVFAVSRALDAEAMSKQEVEEIIAQTKGHIEELRAVCPPPLPEQVAAYYESAPSPFRDGVLSGVTDAGQWRELAEAAWRHIGARPPPRAPGRRFPSPRAAGKIVIWTTGIGLLFLIVPFVSNFNATVMEAMLAFSPIGACGIIAAFVSAGLASRARKKEGEDRHAYQREYDEYLRHAVLVGSWSQRIRSQLDKAERDLELLPQLATHLAAFEAFQTDPKRGGRIEEFVEERPDLEDRMGELATMMEIARGRGGRDDDIEALDDSLGAQ